MRAGSQDQPQRSEVVEPRVFISYSRRDSEIAEWLRAELETRGFDAYLDVHDIAPGEDWRDRLHNLITTAEKVVFLISPASVASEICGWEVEHAEELGKTILPVVVRDAPHDAIPERLTRLNFMFMRDTQEQRGQLGPLEEALTLDLAWEREKARVTDDAVAWDEAGRPNRLLLFSKDAIRAAELWRDARPAQAPALTEMQTAFIDGSRQRRSVIQRRVAIASSCVAVITVIATVFAVISRQDAVESERVATRRAAIMSAGTAGNLAQSGATNEALLVLLEAAKAFEPDTAPDALLIGFDQALRSASGMTRYALSATMRGFSVPEGLLLHDPTTGAVSFFDGSAAPQPVGTLTGQILALAETTVGPGVLAVTEGQGSLTIATVDYQSRRVTEVGQVSGFAGGPHAYAQISSNGLVFANNTQWDAQDSMIFDSRTGKVMDFADRLAQYGDIATDSAGRTFLLPAINMEEVPILEIGEAFELTPVATDQTIFGRLRFDRCMGVAVSDPRVQAARAALTPEQVEQLFVWTGSSMLLGASAYGDLTCDRQGLTVMVHLSVLNNRVSVRQSTLLELSSGQASFEYMNGTPKSANIAAFWKIETDPYDDWQTYGIADPDFSDIRMFEASADEPYPRDPLKVIGENGVVEALSAPRPGMLLVLRAAGVTTSDRAPDLRLAAYDLDGLQSYGTTSFSYEDMESGELQKTFAPVLRPRICATSGNDQIFLEDIAEEDPISDEVDVPTGSVRISNRAGAGDASEVSILEYLDQDGVVTETLELNWDESSGAAGCATLSHTREWLQVPSGDAYRVLSTSPEDAEKATLPPVTPGGMSSVSFFGAGPSLISADALSGTVVLWEPAQTGSGWTQRPIFSGRNQLISAQSDASGKRLAIVESPEGPFRRGFIYSLEAGREWRDIGTGFRGMDISFLSDGTVFSSGSGTWINRLHSLDEAVDAAKAALAPECLPDTSGDWSRSPCWPTGL